MPAIFLKSDFLVTFMDMSLWIYVISWHNFEFLALGSTSKLAQGSQNSGDLRFRAESHFSEKCDFSDFLKCILSTSELIQGLLLTDNTNLG